MACDKCKDSPMAPFVMLENGVMDICICERTKLSSEIDDKLQQKSRIQKKYWDQSLESFLKNYRPRPIKLSSVATGSHTATEINALNEPFFTKLKLYVKSPSNLISHTTAKVLWVYADHPCSGKTTVATLIGASAAKSMIKTIYYSIRDLQDTFQNFEKLKENPIDSIVGKYELFIIDDLLIRGVCPISSDYIKSCIIDFIDKIVSSNKTIIITASVPAQDIPDDMQHIQSIIAKVYESMHIHGSLRPYFNFQ